MRKASPEYVVNTSTNSEASEDNLLGIQFVWELEGEGRVSVEMINNLGGQSTAITQSSTAHSAPLSSTQLLLLARLTTRTRPLKSDPFCKQP